MKLILSMVFTVICVVPLYAQANWETTSESNAFSGLDSATMYSTDYAQKGMVFDCANGSLTFSYVERDPQQPGERFDPFTFVPMRLKIGSDTVDFDMASMSRRNSEYVAISSSDYMQTRHALYMMRNAKHPITLSVKIGSKVFNVTIPASNVKKEAEKVARACDIDLTYKVWENQPGQKH